MKITIENIKLIFTSDVELIKPFTIKGNILFNVSNPTLINNNYYDDEFTYLIKYGNKTIGALLLNFKRFEQEKNILLTDLFIEEKYRNKGIGTKIMNEVERIAKENIRNKIVLFCENDRLIKFYKNLNYIPFQTWMSKEITE